MNKLIIYLFILSIIISCKQKNIEINYYNQNIEFVYNMKGDSSIQCNDIILNGKLLELANDTTTLRINTEVPSIKVEHFPEYISFCGYTLNPLIIIDSFCKGNSCPVKRSIYDTKANLVYYNYSSKYVGLSEFGNLDSLLHSYEITKDEYQQNSNQININQHIVEVLNKKELGH